MSLGDDPVAARDDVLALSRALAALHAGTLGTAEGSPPPLTRRGLPAVRDPWWPKRLAAAAPAFTEEAAGLGVAGADLAGDLDRMAAVLTGRFVGLVHGDPCPDNVLIFPGGSRVLDFERASMASVALDAAYLLALPQLLVLRGCRRTWWPRACPLRALGTAGVARGRRLDRGAGRALALFLAVVRGRLARPALDAPPCGAATAARPRLAQRGPRRSSPRPAPPRSRTWWRPWPGGGGTASTTAVPGYPALGDQRSVTTTVAMPGPQLEAALERQQRPAPQVDEPAPAILDPHRRGRRPG